MELEGTIKELPEITWSPTGKKICTFHIDGIKCVAWQELADKIDAYILVGDKVKVYGAEKERWWTTPEGEKRSAKEVTVSRIQVLERPKPIEYCCYYCLHFNLDCLRGCYNALGGISYLDDCEKVDGKCTLMKDNMDCWEKKGQ